MINIGIDVHKKKCHATIKGDTREILEQTVFNNTLQGIRNFAGVVKDRYGGARAVCESTANYWIMLHDMLEEDLLNFSDPISEIYQGRQNPITKPLI